MKLNAKTHGILDYLTVIFLLAAPWLFGLPETTSIFTYALAGIHLTMTMLTNFELGLFKVVPFQLHGWVELIVGISLIGLAFVFGNLEGDLARNFYLVFGVVLLATWFLTDYKSHPTSQA